MSRMGSSSGAVAKARLRAGLGWGLALALCWVAVACGRSSLELGEYEIETVGGAGGGGGTPVTGGAPTTTTTTSTGAMGGGGTGGCGSATECDDGDFCTTDTCEGGQCFHELRDDDGDGFVAEVCGGNDCNDLNPNVFPGNPEDCFDGSDNDCNGLIDCFDPACLDVPNCGCIPSPGGEVCDNGEDDDCDMTVDCNDVDCIGTPACGCAATEAGLCQNGFDDDCDGLFDCDDPDCAQTAACQCAAIPEDCSNGIDDDCDLLIDCADPECAGTAACSCIPPGSPENCGDNLDNDCDGLVDCADPDCIASPLCVECTSEVCDDGLDNNCNNLIDCADPACFFAPNCAPVAEICNNGLDDDNDTLIDCLDPDCANNPFCVLQQSNCLSPKLISGSGTFTGDTTGNVGETKGSCGGDAGEAVFYFVLNQPSFVHLDSIGTSFDSTIYVRAGSCKSGKEIGCDDDSANSAWAALLEFTILYPGTYYVFLDGFTVDPFAGANEGPFVLNVEIIPNPPEICDDGKDNDGDIYVDCADPDCTFHPSCLNCAGGQPPEPEFGPGRCTDGIDNDCDGTVDCGDTDCSASDYYVTECCDGTDENGNGIVDDFNCRCNNSSECQGGQICYTHTAYACGIPCTSFFGDVCPFVAPGSFCSPVTEQCEF
jgi:hypothetical protein